MSLRVGGIILAAFFLANYSLCTAETIPAPFTAFGKIEVAPLRHGEILTQTNTSMSFARGISAQAAYFLALPPAEAARLLQTWNPATHTELETYQYHWFQTDAEARFDSLKIEPKNDSMRRLLQAMSKPEELQLGADEITAVPNSIERRAAEKFWTGVLRSRWNVYRASGWSALPVYDVNGERFAVATEMKSLLAEERTIAAHFSALLNDARSGRPSSDVSQEFYWSLSKVDKLAAVDLGANFAAGAEGHWQLLDTDFYVSSGYFGAITFYELWPAGHGTLVWQCDLVSAPGLAGGFGLKRKIASLLIQNDVKTTVRALQQEAERSRPASATD